MREPPIPFGRATSAPIQIRIQSTGAPSLPVLVDLEVGAAQPEGDLAGNHQVGQQGVNPA